MFVVELSLTSAKTRLRDSDLSQSCLCMTDRESRGTAGPAGAFRDWAGLTHRLVLLELLELLDLMTTFIAGSRLDCKII